MGLVTKVFDFFGGSLGGKLIDTVKDYFPPSMSDQEKARLDIALLQIKSDVDLKLKDILNEEEELFNGRIKDLEGTANDLKTIPIIGPILIFMRGALRPIFGFGTLVMDFMVFSGEWVIQDGTRQDTSFLLINILVLSFLFGERAFRNVAPLIERLVKK